jgi:7-cyano-7-deazaguanine tRNA-ribosyltransferase
MSEKLLLWIGEQPSPVKTDRSSDLVMDSVINYYDSDQRKPGYEWGQLFLDNGAFTARMKGVTLQRDRVIKVQESIDPDLTIPLDYPFKVGEPQNSMKKLWNKTQENITYWQTSTNLRKRLVPALHAWDKNSLIRNIRWLERNADSDFIALGSIVGPRFQKFDGFFGDRQPSTELVDMLALAISSVQRLTDFKVHLMGFGSSPLMLHLGYYLGAQSTDSTGYRRKAAFGKIVLPGKGERHVGDDSVTGRGFGKSAMSINEGNPNREEDLALLKRCGCPVCTASADTLWIDWKARAIHNEFVMKQEASVAHYFSSKGESTYESYLDRVVFPGSSLRYLWEYAKLRKNYYRISDVMFHEGV